MLSNTAVANTIAFPADVFAAFGLPATIEA
jgi:hypothetical protein